MLLFGLKFNVFEDLVPLPLKRRSLVTFSAVGESNIKEQSGVSFVTFLVAEDKKS